MICSGTILGEISGTDQEDIIHILPQATLLYYLTDSGDSLSEAMIIGIYGFQGNDEITNEGEIEELGASAKTTAVGVSLTIDGIVEGDPLSDSSATANASATGIDGGADNDTINNEANISADAQAVVTATDVTTDITVTAYGNASGAALSDASVTANAAATGIEGGSGIDEINNRGDIALIANTEATGVAVSLDVAGTMEGNAEGSSVSDASVTATSTTTGIDGGEDTDFIDNRGDITLLTTSDASGVAVALNIAGTMKGDAEGSSVSDTSVTATSTATGIDGGAGNDTIVSDGPAISADVGADATAVSVTLAVSGSMEGNVAGEALSDSSTTANAMATGIDGGMGQDTIDNWSYIFEDVDASATAVGVGLNIAITEEGNASGAALSDASVKADAAATGIDGGGDSDDIDNRGDIELLTNSDATGVAVALTVSGSMEGNVAGEALSDSSAMADATAIGIDGGLGIDEITNRGTIFGNVDSSATAVGVAVDIGITKDGNASGAALSDASVTADAAATGIDGGGDSDDIDNRGNIELSANSDATGVAVSLDVAGTMKGDAEGSSVSDASVTATSTATGIEGGDGDDTIDNDSLITTAYVDADAKAVNVGLTVSGSMEGNVAGEALSDGSATADATAIGISGGLGLDTIDNWSIIYQDVDAGATTVAAAVDVAISIDEGGNATGAALSDASVTANAAATGIDGGGDADDIDNRGAIELLSNSYATGVDVSLTVAGTMKGDAEGSSVSDASVTATSAATGIEGGEGDDTIENEGMITLMNGSGDDETDANATAVSVGLTVSGSMEGNVAGEALSDSSATADAMAIGIDGGSGIDEITNRGVVVGSVDSSATAVGVAVDVDITEDGDATGAALSDASVAADAAATGIDGGGDSDDIDNRGNIELSANSDATGVAVSLDVAGTMKGDAEGSSVSDASVTATSTATGIEGGEGDDTIDNDGLYNLVSEAEGDSVAASVTIAGTVIKKGVAGADVNVTALSNASSTAEAITVGLDGGEGNDTISNMSDLEQLKANAESDAVAVSVGVDFVVTTKGASEIDLEGAALSDASASATAVVAGLDAGDGDDTLVNEGDLLDLETYAKSNSDAVSVDIAGNIVSKGAATGDVKGEAVSDASSTADAVTVGLDGGEGNDTITNRGDLELLKANAESDAVAVSVGVDFAITTKGASNVDIEGAALSDASASATAVVAGLDAGDGDDTLVNEGDLLDLEAYAKSNSDAVAVELAGNVTIKGAATGDVKGEAVSDASSKAEAFTVGLDGGEGNDIITNRGDLELLKAKAESDADSVAASVAVSVPIKGVSFVDVEGASLSNSSATAEAVVTGLDAGDGDDRVMSEGDLIKLEAEADADSLAVSVTIAGTVGGDARGLALSEASATADATAAGISGGEGDDILDNQAKIDAKSTSISEAKSVSADVTVQVAGGGGECTGSALSDSSATSNATATGIDGGEGNDEIDNEGELVTLADADADSLAVSVAIGVGSNGVFGGELESEAASDASSTAEAVAEGIAAGAGDDILENSGKISADVHSTATSDSISADVAVEVGANGKSSGAALSDSSATALATAVGIDGGVGNDIITNKGDITLMQRDEEWNAHADALAVGVSIGFAGAFSGASGSAISNSSAMSDAGATGIAGGEGDDAIDNWAAISADVGSRAEAISASAALAVSLQGGSASAASLADASATGVATATGINGGEGTDSIVNNADITMKSRSEAEAEAISVSFSVAPGGVSATSAMADSSALAVSESTGIQGEGGADDIDNGTNLGDSEVDPSLLKITTDSQSTATANSITVEGSATVGLSDGASVANSSATSEASSTGIDGGLGNDTIDNAIEIEAASLADATANSTNVTVGLSVGASGSSSLGDSSATARANATGIEGGADDDTITNTAAITAGAASDNPGPMAQAQADSTTVDVGIAVGYTNREASANSSAFAEAKAAGISGGSGDDWIDNSGTITVGPDPLGTGSMASAIGTSTAVKVGVTVGESLGTSSSDTSSTAVANLAGIKGGSGNDTVYNSGSITVGRYFSDSEEPEEAMATAYAASETVDVSITVGKSSSDASSNASSTAQSNSIGIETDSGIDFIDNDNTGVINVFSSSEAVGLGQTTAVSFTVGASDVNAQSNASSLSTALATGIDSGGDADEIITDSDVVVKARAISTTLSEAENYNLLSLGSAVQSAEANSSSTAEAIARGIDGGTGADIITVAGNYDVSADTLVESTSRSSTLTGFSGGENEQEAQSRAGTVSDALAIGIDGGEGSDTITSTATLTVNAFSNADTEATSASSTGFNIVGSSSGESVSGATSNVTATGIGIRGGTSVLDFDDSDVDVITNEGVINVTTTVSAVTDSTSTADSITFIGKAEGAAMSDASATVLADGIGIDGGADNDTITSKNTISVKTTANVSITSTSNADSYATFGGAYSRGASDASAEVLTEATGISGGTGDDEIISHALVDVEAKSIGSVTATSNVNADVTFGGASSEAASDTSVTKQGSATGIDGGDGSDEITNYNTLNVKAEVDGAVTSKANADADATFGSTSSITTTDASLEGAVDTRGIIGGSGDDTVTNLGRVDSIAEATLHVINSSVATAESTFGSSEARAYSVSTIEGKASSLGVSGDDGSDLIENAGTVNVRAIANADIETVTVAIAKSTFGGSDTEAASSNYAAGESTAEGITTGAGNDGILNTEVVTVEAGGTVSIESAVYSSDGPASSDARTMALSHASGIDSGADDDTVTNMATVFVKAAPRIESATRTFGEGGVIGNVGILLDAEAMGITGGEGDDTISNGGNVLVFIGAPETESNLSEEATNGETAVTDNNLIGEDPEAIVGKWLRIAGDENPDFFTQVEAFDPQTGELTLRDALVYDLPSDATYTICDYGYKEVDITEVDATVGGNTRVDVSTTASIDATGIEGGDGDDEIANSGSVAVSASNMIETVSFKITGTVNADTDIESTVHATGIAGDGKDDTSDVSEESAGGTVTFIDEARIGEDPEAIVGKRIRFTTGESADFFTVVVAFDPETGKITLSDPIPEGGLSEGDSYALGGGSNGITNEGVINVAANSAINAASWSLSFGSANIEANGKARAVSAGVEGGEYDDFVGNTGRIDTLSTSNVLSIERALVFFGGTQQELVFEAVSNSAGISAGAGDDIIVNGDDESAELAAINVDAVATANVNGVTTTFINFRETNNLVDARSASTAMGIDLGEGQNAMYNTGEIDVSADSTTVATAISNFSLYEETNARANATATAIASGISAEDGGDTVQSSGAITIDATAMADSEAQGSDVIGGSENDFSSAVTEDSESGSTTFIDESLIPEQGEDPVDIVGQYVRFLTGDNKDFTTQVTDFNRETGTVTLDEELPEDLKAERDDNGTTIPADEYTIANGRDGESGAFATAFATGINLNNGLDNGDSMVEIGEALHVRADAEANSTATVVYNGTANAGATATAEARGIVTGDGDDLVVNEGTIIVEAEASTSVSGSGVTESITAAAVGIETGAGDDTILNSGSIVTGVVLNGADPVAGIGILAGAGNDTVELHDAARVIGSIEMGEGNDVIAFADTATVEGAIKGGSDIDTIRINDRGTFTVDPPEELECLEVSQGVLEIQGDYVLPSLVDEGLVHTEIYATGNGQLSITDTGSLDGQLRVTTEPRAYVSDDTFDVTVADTFVGEYALHDLPGSRLLSFDINYLQDPIELDRAQVVVDVTPFTAVAGNSVQRHIAEYLDRITPSATGDMGEVIGTFQLLDESEFNEAFASLSPGLYDNSTRTMFDTNRRYTSTLLKRIHSVQMMSAHAVPHNNIASREGESLLAYNGSAASIGRLYAPAKKKQSNYGIWLDGFGQWGDRDEDDGFTGYDYNVHGVTLGIDRMFRDRLIAGISIGYSDTDVDVDRDQGEGDIDTVYGSLYGSYYTQRGYIDAALSCGNQDYYNKRRVVIGPIEREARSDHDGDMFSAFAEGGYNIDVNAWALQPFASLHYLNLDEEGFTEKGADSANLIISARETESLVSELGLRITRLYEVEKGTLIPELSMAWSHDFDIDDRTITSAFAGAPDSAFSIEGQHVEKQGLTIGTGITFINKKGFTTSVKYNGEFRDGYGAHGIIGELRYEF